MDTFKVQALKLKATNYGLSWGDVANILEKWGPKALEFIVGVIEDGFSVDLIVRILTDVPAYRAVKKPTSDPTNVKEALNKLFDSAKEKPSFKAAPVPIIEGEQVFDSALTDVLLKLLLSALPELLRAYGPQIIEAIVKALLDGFKADPQTFKTAISGVDKISDR